MLSLNRPKFLSHIHLRNYILFQRVKSSKSPGCPYDLHFSPAHDENDPSGLHRRLNFILRSDARQIDTIKSTKSFHGLAITVGSHQPLFLQNNLVTLYARFGDLLSANQVFDEMPERNIASWNSIIAAHARHGLVDEAWELLSLMMGNGFMPNQFTLGSVLPLCCASFSLPNAVQLHGLMVKTGLSGEVHAGTALLGVLVKYGCLDDALNLFDEIPQRNVVTWNVVISGFAEHGLSKEAGMWFRELMRSEDIRPSESSFVAAISACRQMQGVELGEQIHGLLVKFGGMFYVVIANAVADMYAKFMAFGSTETVFDEMLVRDSISWNTLIMSFLKKGRDDKALELFLKMLSEGFRPSQGTFSMVLSSCARTGNLNYGRSVHGKAIKANFEDDPYVVSAIIALYAKCDHLIEALKAFRGRPEKGVVHWNALMHRAEYAGTTAVNTTYKGDDNLSLQELMGEMMKSDVSPNEYTFSYFLSRSSMTSPENGLQILSQIIRRGLLNNPYVSSLIVSMFAKKGLMSDAYSLAGGTSGHPSPIAWNVIAGILNRSGNYDQAYNLLSGLAHLDAVSWNIIVSACSRSKKFSEAFECFHRMQKTGTQADNYTFTSLLSICSEVCNLGTGQAIHGYMLKTNYEQCDVLVLNVLMNMYAKCGALDGCIKVFDSIPQKNVVSWTVLISAFGLHGQAKQAIKSFKEMKLQGVEPDHVTLLAALSACKHAGLVEEGLSLFQNMKSFFGLDPEMEHLVCVVDLLCKSGNVEEAEKVIKSMPFGTNPVLWRTFLAGCGVKCCC
ncbi:pentatricopeptide repeat-containing protein At3g58590-like [Nymphaea colorata]|uniref:Pentacotripeptide-repeat region of PRORP domain-containing protein n=1 Tax=Nymphaea colorata TaxID=210225 RepID=A0A5K0WD64_9MAGN|nr:pentatricopeptide repeat-containing protein At3g58590-like [Nymphaea colorata]